MDFNLIIDMDGSRNEDIQNIIQRSYDLGYETIAINTIVSSSNLSGKNINIPEPKHITFDGKLGQKFTILNRLTAIIEDSIHAHHLLKSPITKKYDILAIQPTSEKLLQHVTSSLDIDIICLNLSEDLGFTIKRNHVGLAFQKGICFEISYSPCLRSQSCRRSIISNSQLLVEVCKSKNVIVSSGALKPLELRSPEDIVNLSLLFGFKRNLAVDAVRKTGHAVISHAGTRRNTGCGFVSITGCMKIPKQQGWIVKICKVPPLSTGISTQSSKRKAEKNIYEDSKQKKKKCKNKYNDE